MRNARPKINGERGFYGTISVNDAILGTPGLKYQHDSHSPFL